MPYLIDGNNLLGSWGGPKGQDDRRNEVVRRVLAFCRAKNAKATWISPVTGEKKDAGTFATGNRTGAVFPGSPQQFFKTPPFWEDAVLLLEGVD